MTKEQYTEKISQKINTRDFAEIENLIYPLADLYIQEDDYQQAITALNLMGEVLMHRGYSPDEKVRLEEKKISVFENMGQERDVLISMKVIAETYKMFNDNMFADKLNECLAYYENMKERIPGDKEYLLGILLNYYKDNGMHAEAAILVKDIIKHKAINGIAVTLSDYYDCLYYADNNKTRGIIINNIESLIKGKVYEISISEIIAMKDLVALCRHLNYSDTEKLLLDELNQIMSQDEYSFYKEFIS